MNIVLEDILDEVYLEVEKATSKFGSFNSTHEGYAVLAEEVDEMWDEVKGNNIDRSLEEAVQVAAMAVRYIYDIRNKYKK